MNNEEKTLCSLKARSWPWRYMFVLTTDALIQEWTKPVETAKGSLRYPLADLSPRLNHQMAFGHGSEPPLRKAFFYLAGAACVFFSQFSHQIPLLAPLLAVLGTWSLITGVCRLRQCDWTIINKKNGERAFSIPHSKSNRSEMEMFERLFVETVTAHGQVKSSANQVPEDTACQLADPQH